MLLNQNVQAWGLVLPLLGRNGRYMYYVITDDWRERVYVQDDDEVKYILPKLEGCTY